jgi:hypothetical protein
MRPPRAADVGKIRVGLSTTRRLLWMPVEGYQYRIYPSSEAMKLWSERFRAHARGAAVFHPAFENYEAKFNQAFCFSTLDQFTTRSRWPRSDKEFIEKLIVESDSKGKVAYVPAEAQGQSGKLKPLDQVRDLVTYLDREAVLARIEPELASKLGVEDSGIACPSNHPGLFLLCSL